MLISSTKEGVIDDTFAILCDCKAVVLIITKYHVGTIVNIIGSIVGEMYIVVSLDAKPSPPPSAQLHGMPYTALPRLLLTASAKVYPWYSFMVHKSLSNQIYSSMPSIVSRLHQYSPL